MTPPTKQKWLRRAAIKTALLNDGRAIESLSGRWLNRQAGLPENAVWRESNFA